MQAIVNGLQEDYSDNITFVSLNAKDNENGEILFQHLGLRGHPAILMYSVDAEEVFRQLGIVDESMLIDKLVEILAE